MLTFVGVIVDRIYYFNPDYKEDMKYFLCYSSVNARTRASFCNFDAISLNESPHFIKEAKKYVVNILLLSYF